MYQKEVRYLLSKLQLWDVTGEGKLSFDEVYQVGSGLRTLVCAARKYAGRKTLRVIPLVAFKL